MLHRARDDWRLRAHIVGSIVGQLGVGGALLLVVASTLKTMMAKA